MTTQAEYRLPPHVRPKRYVLTLAPDLASFTFGGDETVELEVDEPTDRILLNAAELHVSAASVTLADGTVLAAQDIAHDEAAETVALRFERPVPAGGASLSVEFTGILNDQLRGFYRSQYTDANGDTCHLATTQFEPTDARRAFPCWDEPARKATFQVTLRVPRDLVAVSNMPVESEEDADGGLKDVRFAETPAMSTYILAFVVGDLASVEATAKGGTLVRVWALRGKEEQGRFAVENAVRLLDYFNDYFGVPYPLPKLDHLALPDFAAGAMENWGAITYREVALLYDPQNSGASTRQRILQIVSHEMAHMWFGDLVTMEWWDDLWLNESFASWMGDKAVDHLYPEWHVWTQFVSHDTNAGLSLDGLRNSHPIEAKVANPAEIQELFDAISYSKGAAVLRMLEQFLGPDTFQRGLQAYIARHQYGNARTSDLWDALEQASGQPVTAIMDTWTGQMGYPLLRVSSKPADGGVEVTLSQQRFLYDHLLGAAEDPALWRVPVSLLTSDASEAVDVLLTEREATVRLPDPASGDGGWLKANPGQTGFFRIDYAPEEWERLRTAVAGRQLPAIDRLGLQDDAYALVRAGMAPASLFLALAEAYREEEDATVWGDLAANLRSLDRLLFDSPCLPQYRAYAADIFSGIVAKVGWDPQPGEGHLDALRRIIVLGSAGHYGVGGVLDQAKERFQRALEDPGSVHPDLRAVVYGLTAQGGDAATYEAMWDLQRRAELHEEKLRLLGALCRFTDPDLLRETLRRTLTTDVRSQDTVMLIGAVAAGRSGRDLAWDFLVDNWEELDRRYGSGGFALMRLVSIAGGFTTLERAQEVEDFFRDHPAPAAARTIQQSLEAIRLSARWLELNEQVVAGWLDERR